MRPLVRGKLLANILVRGAPVVVLPAPLIPEAGVARAGNKRWVSRGKCGGHPNAAGADKP